MSQDEEPGMELELVEPDQGVYIVAWDPDEGLIAETRALAAEASAIVVGDAASLAGAETMLREVRTLKTDLGKSLADRIKPMNDEIARLRAAYHPAATEIEAANKSVDAAVRKWRREEEVKRRQAELEAEAKAEQARVKALKKADEYREQGRDDKATVWEEKAIYTPTPVVKSLAPKTPGVSYRTKWFFKVIDKALLPMPYLIPNEPAIQSVVDGLHEEHPFGRAIEVWSDQVTVARKIT